MKLYVGNLSYSTTEDTLKTLFSNYADVASVSIAKDRFTQQSKGFGFVEIDDEIKAQRAIGGMNGKDVDGRRIRVSEAVEKSRSERSDFDDEGYSRRPRDYDRRDSRDYDRRDSRDYGRRDSDYRDSGRRFSGDRRDSHDFNSESFGRRGYGRRDYENDGGYGRRNYRKSDRRDGGSYGRFSRHDDNPDEY